MAFAQGAACYRVSGATHDRRTFGLLLTQHRRQDFDGTATTEERKNLRLTYSVVAVVVHTITPGFEGMGLRERPTAQGTGFIVVFADINRLIHVRQGSREVDVAGRGEDWIVPENQQRLEFPTPQLFCQYGERNRFSDLAIVESRELLRLAKRTELLVHADPGSDGVGAEMLANHDHGFLARFDNVMRQNVQEPFQPLARGQFVERFAFVGMIVLDPARKFFNATCQFSQEGRHLPRTQRQTRIGRGAGGRVASFDHVEAIHLAFHKIHLVIQRITPLGERRGVSEHAPVVAQNVRLNGDNHVGLIE